MLIIALMIYGLAGVESGPAISLEAATSVDSFALIVRRGEVLATVQGGRVLGSLEVLDNADWRPVELVGCGAGIRQVTLSRGRHTAGHVYPMMYGHRSPPGTYRFSVSLNDAAGGKHFASRAFRVPPMPRELSAAILDELSASASAQCAVDWDIVESLATWAGVDEHKLILADARLPAPWRAHFLESSGAELQGQFLLDAVRNGPSDIGAVAALVIARSYPRSVEPEVLHRLVDTLNGPDVLFALDALTRLTGTPSSAWPDVDKYVVDMLEAGAKLEVAFAISELLIARESLARETRKRAVTALVALSRDRLKVEASRVRGWAGAVSSGAPLTDDERLEMAPLQRRKACVRSQAMTSAIQRFGLVPRPIDLDMH